MAHIFTMKTPSTYKCMYYLWHHIFTMRTPSTYKCTTYYLRSTQKAFWWHRILNTELSKCRATTKSKFHHHPHHARSYKGHRTQKEGMSTSVKFKGWIWSYKLFLCLSKIGLPIFDYFCYLVDFVIVHFCLVPFN